MELEFLITFQNWVLKNISLIPDAGILAGGKQNAEPSTNL